MTGPGTDDYLFEFDDEENEIENDDIDDDERDQEDIDYDNDHAPSRDHRDY